MEWVRPPSRRGRYWEIHPWCPRDFPRPERFPEGEARGKSWGSREISRAEGMDFPITPEFWWRTDILSSSIFLQGVDQEILPCGQGRIDSAKINPSLLMMTDCILLLTIFCSSGILIPPSWVIIRDEYFADKDCFTWSRFKPAPNSENSTAF